MDDAASTTWPGGAAWIAVYRERVGGQDADRVTFIPTARGEPSRGAGKDTESDATEEEEEWVADGGEGVGWFPLLLLRDFFVFVVVFVFCCCFP
ncbi:unnamed protein product [Lampetra fluviatilis]